MQTILQNSAVRPLVFVMYDEADHITGLTGLSPTVVISKNGGSFASPSGAVSEIGNGFYKVAPNATDSNTIGTLALSATDTGADQATMAYDVVAYNPDDAVRLGLTALPNAAADAAGGLPISDAGGLDLDTKLANTDQVTTARMAALTDWINGGRLDLLLDAIKASTDNLPSDPADASDVAGAFSTVNSTLSTIAGYLDTEIAAILADTNELQTDWANGGRLDLLIDAIKAVTDADGGANAIETGISKLQAIRGILAGILGVATGGNTTDIELKNPAGDTTRATVTTDQQGSRSAIVLNL